MRIGDCDSGHPHHGDEGSEAHNMGAIFNRLRQMLEQSRATAPELMHVLETFAGATCRRCSARVRSISNLSERAGVAQGKLRIVLEVHRSRPVHEH